jgi:hypothetical protein
MWHFPSSEECPPNYGMVSPGKISDETVVPFLEQLLMKQYIPIKAQKYGI